MLSFFRFLSVSLTHSSYLTLVPTLFLTLAFSHFIDFFRAPLILSNWCSVSSFRALFIPLPFCAFIFFRAPFYILSFFVFGSFRALFHSTFCPPFSHRCCVFLSLCSCSYITLYDVVIGRSIADCYCLI